MILTRKRPFLDYDGIAANERYGNIFVLLIKEKYIHIILDKIIVKFVARTMIFLEIG